MCTKLCTKSYDKLWLHGGRCWEHKDCSAAQPLIKRMPFPPLHSGKKSGRNERDEVEEWWKNGENIGSVCFHVLACPFEFSGPRTIFCWGRGKPVQPCLFGPSLANLSIPFLHMFIMVTLQKTLRRLYLKIKTT